MLKSRASGTICSSGCERSKLKVSFHKWTQHALRRHYPTLNEAKLAAFDHITRLLVPPWEYVIGYDKGRYHSQSLSPEIAQSIALVKRSITDYSNFHDN
jgi:hypothetical protein